MPTLAQDITITSADQLARVALSANYSMYLPFEPWNWRAYPLEWPLWCDSTSLSCLNSLPASTNFINSMDWSNVPLASVVLTKDVISGVVTVSADGTNVIATIPAPSGYQPGAAMEDHWLWSWYVSITNAPDAWGLTPDQILPPTVTLHTFLADSNAYYSVYESNLEAEAEAAAAVEALSTPSFAMNSEMMLQTMDNSDPCSIPDDAAAFSVLSIAQDTNYWTTTTWQSCPDHVYVVQSEFSLTPTSSWTDVAWMWGGNGTTNWTDTSTVGQTQGFYRVVRGNPNTLNNGVPYGWAVTYGLDPLDPNLALGDPLGDGFSNLEKYLLGYTPNDYLSDRYGSGTVTTLRYYYDQDGRLVDAFYATAGAETFGLTPGHNLQQDNALSH
jgi:hypothetical protein